MKKFFIVSLVMFFLMCSFYIAYNLLLKDKKDNTKDNVLENIEKVVSDNYNKEDRKLGEMDKIVDTKSDFIFMDAEEGKVRYYNLENGGFWMTSFDGSFKKKIVSDKLDDLKEVKWNKDGKKALLKIGEEYYSYNFDEGKKNIKKSEAMDWLNFGEEITYVFDDQKNKKKTINVSNQDGSNWKEVAEVKGNSFIMQSIPRSSKTAFWVKPDSFFESELGIVSAGGMGIEKIGDLKFGADYLWSPEGNRFLRSYVSEKGGKNLNLEYCDAREGKCSNLNFETLASKCVWMKNNKSIICAEVANLDDVGVMPNDYSEGKFIAKGLFWQIDIEDGKKQKIIEDKDIKYDVDATSLILSPKEDFLFFINKTDKSLFRLKL